MFYFSSRSVAFAFTYLATLVVPLSVLAQESPSPSPTTASPLAEVIVTAPSPDYRATEVSTATKTDFPLRDLPASVQVITRELLEDRGVTRIEQALDNVSGVHAESSYGGNGATFFNIRGFTSFSGLRDGFRNYGYLAFRDIQSIERIEVLKGPAGALYGPVGSLGGYINTESKRPGTGWFGEVGLTSGSFGLIRPTLDANIPVGESASARLNAAYEHNDTFRDQGGYDSFSIAPAFRWTINKDTTLTLLGEYNRRKREGFDFGIPNVPQYTSLPRNAYYGLRDDFGSNDTYATTLLMTHRISDEWSVRAGAHYTYGSQRSTQTFPDLSSYTGGNSVPYYTYLGADEDNTDYAIQAELLGQFHTAMLKHHVLLGSEYSYADHGSGGTPNFGFNMDLHHPGSVSDRQTTTVPQGSRASADMFGIYAQDFVDLTKQVKLLGGLRGDWFFNNVEQGGSQVAESDEAHVSLRTGIVWQPFVPTSLYFGWNKAYAPNIGHGTSSATFEAEEAEQFEVGVKQELIPDRLSATLCAYHLTRENILTSDPENPLNQILAGEQRSRGLELDVAGTIVPGWKVIASYAYTEAEVVRDTNLPAGDELTNVPRHSGSLWSTWQFQKGALQGWGVGAGLYYVGEREANLPNVYKLGAYWRTDATLFYERSRWRAQVNFLNVFDRHYYTGGEAGVFNYTLNPSQPFSVQGTVTYKF